MLSGTGAIGSKSRPGRGAAGSHVGRRNPSARQAYIRSRGSAGLPHGEEPVAASKVRRLSCREAISVNVGLSARVGRRVHMRCRT